jgi:lipopolysaccharide export system permease protein
MKILDKFIIKKFLVTFLFVVLVLCSVICVIDFTEKNDDFIKTQPGIRAIIFDYYLNYIPYLANMISPITVFIATVFVTARMAARTEIIAILSSGVSFVRMLVPYLMGAMCIGVATFFLTGWIIPNANKERVAFEIKYIKNKFYFDGRNVHIKVGPESFAYIESYNNTVHTGYQFTLETIKGQTLTKKVKADKIIWQADKNAWKLENCVVRGWDANGKEYLANVPQIDTVINLYPKDFESQHHLYETFTNPELDEYIAEAKSRGADDIEIYVIEKYLRFTYPFAILILTMIGVILSARKSREGAGFQIALGFLLAFIYIIFFIMSRSIAQTGAMPPLLATWLPNLVFATIGVFLYKTVPR